MGAKHPETINFIDEDHELFLKAVEKYGVGKSELLREIVHSWLFDNKLNLLDEEKKDKKEVNYKIRNSEKKRGVK